MSKLPQIWCPSETISIKWPCTEKREIDTGIFTVHGVRSSMPIQCEKICKNGHYSRRHQQEWPLFKISPTRTATIQDVTNNYELNDKSYMGCDFKQYYGNHSPGHLTAHHANIHKSTRLRFAVTAGGKMWDQNDQTDIYIIITIHMPCGPPCRPLQRCTRLQSKFQTLADFHMRAVRSVRSTFTSEFSKHRHVRHHTKMARPWSGT